MSLLPIHLALWTLQLIEKWRCPMRSSIRLNRMPNRTHLSVWMRWLLGIRRSCTLLCSPRLPPSPVVSGASVGAVVSPTLPLEPGNMILCAKEGPNHRLFKTFRKVWNGSHSETYQNILVQAAELPSLLNRRLQDFAVSMCKVKYDLAPSIAGKLFKVAQNSFQHILRRRFWWVIITTLNHLMLQSWYQKTAQSFVNTLVLFSWHDRLP